MMQRFQVETIRLVLETVTETVVITTGMSVEPVSVITDALKRCLSHVGVENVRLGERSRVAAVGNRPHLTIYTLIGGDEHGFLVDCLTGLVRETFDAKGDFSKSPKVEAVI